MIAEIFEMGFERYILRMMRECQLMIYKLADFQMRLLRGTTGFLNKIASQEKLRKPVVWLVDLTGALWVPQSRVGAL